MSRLSKPINKKITIYEVITSLIVGITASVVNLVVSHIAYDYIHINENAVTIIAWLISAFIAYILNYKLVFKNKYSLIKSEFKKLAIFMLIRSISYFIEALFIYIFVTVYMNEYWVIKIILTIG